jgi:hypothetical protein
MTITPEQLLGVRELVASKVSESEAHRVIKVWRALWKKLAVFGYCDVARDPSLMFANSAPAPRQAVWSEGEAVRTIKHAWREGYYGLAAILAIAWDSQLSPVDARNLRSHDLRRDPVGMWFSLACAKTGRPALATLSRRTTRLLKAYLATQGAEPIGTAMIFRTRSGAPYRKDTLGDDFRAIRTLVFGPGGKPPACRLSSPWSRRGRFWRCLAGPTRLEDGQHPVGVEPLASDLRADAARRSASS